MPVIKLEIDIVIILPLLAGYCLGYGPVGQPQTNFGRVVQNPNPNNGYENYVKATDLVSNPESAMSVGWAPGQYDQLAAGFSPVQAHQSNFDRIIQHPDPNNGYLDYVRATDLVRTPLISMCMNWSPRQYDDMVARKTAAIKKQIALGDPSGAGAKGNADSSEPSWDTSDEAMLAIAEKLHNLDYLAVQQVLDREFQPALALVRSGNQKRVWDPREKLAPDSVFPEMADFKKIGKLIRADAYVRFASGDSRTGTDDLLEGLTFARRIGGGTLIAELVSIATESIVMVGFEEHLSQLSEKDCRQIANSAEAALHESSTYPQSLQREREFAQGSIDYFMSTPSDLDMTGDNSDKNPLEKFLKGISPRERETLKAGVSKSLSEYFDSVASRLAQDESSWIRKPDAVLPPDPPTVLTVQEATDAFVNAVLPDFSQVTTTVLRARAQLRLLDLHARIIDFKWRFNRLPATLSEVAPHSLTFDPLAKSDFEYSLKDGGYRLFSKGAGTTGPIELRYRRPPDPGTGDTDPIPPASREPVRI